MNDDDVRWKLLNNDKHLDHFWRKNSNVAKRKFLMDTFKTYNYDLRDLIRSRNKKSITNLLKRFLEKGLNPNTAGACPLIREAICSSNLEAVRLLVKHGANLESYDDVYCVWPLTISVKWWNDGDNEIFDYLLNEYSDLSDADVSRQLLTEITQIKDSHYLLSEMLKKGLDINVKLTIFENMTIFEIYLRFIQPITNIEFILSLGAIIPHAAKDERIKQFIQSIKDRDDEETIIENMSPGYKNTYLREIIKLVEYYFDNPVRPLTTLCVLSIYKNRIPHGDMPCILFDVKF